MSGSGGLPRGWARARIADLVKLINGCAFKPTDWQDTGLPIVRIQNLNNPNAPYNYHPADGLPEKFLIDTGDLLFAWSGTPGTSFGAHIWKGGQAWLNQHIFHVVFCRDHLNTKFLQLAINKNLDDYIRAAHGGAGLAHITKGKFESSELLIAPLPEQRRIVAKVEELFSDLDAGVAALERVQAKLKRYRAAVLKAAVGGRLTEGWRKKNRSKETGQKLLDRILRERRRKWEEDQLATFVKAGKTPPAKWKEKYKEPAGVDTANLPSLPEGWCWASVRQVGSVQLGRQRSPKHHTGPHMRPYLRVANVFEDRIDTSDVMEMNFTPGEYETYRLGYGDVLLNEGQSMELVGRPAIYRDEVPGACFTNSLVRFQALGGLDPEYALAVFLTYLKNGRFQKIATITINIAHLSAGRFAEIEFPVPPLEEQKQIVAEVKRQSSIIQAIETEVEANRTRSTRLRQSVLKRAFEGRLVPQDPADEAASTLLLRIKTQRGESQKTLALDQAIS